MKTLYWEKIFYPLQSDLITKTVVFFTLLCYATNLGPRIDIIIKDLQLPTFVIVITYIYIIDGHNPVI